MEFVILPISLWIIYLIFKHKKIEKLSKTNSRIPHVSLLFPFKFPIVNSLYHLYEFKTGGTKFMEKLAERYGYLFEIDFGPITTVVTGDADVAQKILCSTEPTHLNKTKAVYELVFVDCMKYGLLNADFSIWAPHRKMLNRCFTYKCYVHYVKIMNRHARDLAKNITSLSTPASLCKMPSSLDHGTKVFEMLYFFSVKIISQILMDTDKYGTEKMEKFAKKPSSMYTECKKESESELLEEDPTESDDGIKPFRCVVKEMISRGATDKEIYDEIGTLIGAGHETTVVAIQMLLQHLALNPEHQSRCREEIKAMFEGKGHFGKIADETECIITIDDLTSLKYLERCILESGRLTSTVPLFMRTLGSPLQLDKDLELASGTNLAILPWILHKNPKYYPNPEKFDPNRFLQENIKIGIHMRTFLSPVVHYEVRSDDKLEDVRLLFEVTLHPQRDFRIKFIPLE